MSPGLCREISEVAQFLEEMQTLLKVDRGKLYIVPRKDHKNQDFMVKHNLKHDDVVARLLKLDVSNYAYTDVDRDSGRGGEVWIFGQALYSSLEYFDAKVVIYIKLKLERGVVCLSFHEAEAKLKYPYL